MSPSLTDFEAARLLVAGDVMLDRYWQGSTSRVSAEAPVAVVQVDGDDNRLGGAGNVAANIAALGGQVKLLALAGQDADADYLENLLQHQNIGAELCRMADYQTIVKLRVLSQNQQLLRLDFEASAPSAGLSKESYDRALEAVDAVVLSDYGKGALADPASFIATAKAAGKAVVVDPKGQDFGRYHGASVVTPNEQEFAAVVGPWKNDAEMAAKALQLCQRFQLDAVLVTRGEQGMLLLESDGKQLSLPTKAQEVYDVTGAGDTVVALLGLALAVGHSLSEAVVLANLAAGVVVGKAGTATLSLAELQHAQRRGGAAAGIVALEALLDWRQQVRQQGKSVVMTNGCFDLLHGGHVHYLRQARKLGDYLIVAVNDDASIRALKGKGRPLLPQSSRFALLAELRCVDWVLPFSSLDPAAIIARLQPDKLVKGGDYQADEIVGADSVRAAGGEVLTIPLLAGLSSTSLWQRWRQEQGE